MLSPVTNTRPPPGLTATELATSESLPGPLNRRAHSFAPGTASGWAVASDCALAGCGARVAAPAALTPATPKVPTTAPAATTAAARLINLPMADLPCADHHGWLPAPPGSRSQRRRCVTSRLPPQPGRTHIDAPLMGPDYRICGIVRTSSRFPLRILSGLANTPPASAGLCDAADVPEHHRGLLQARTEPAGQREAAGPARLASLRR